MKVEEQIKRGKLVCPDTHQALSIENETLVTSDRSRCYPLVKGVPVFIRGEDQEAYLQEVDGSMAETYTPKEQKPPLRTLFLYRLDQLAKRGGDYRSIASQDAFYSILQQQGDDDVFLSVGGGPLRLHPKLTNLNIGLFPNVDVVGDAYSLPYADEAVSAIYCEAVLEHLEFPETAATEMFRVLKQGGELFAATPFLQAFHAFPNHFQNFTSIGHERLFLRRGFEVISSGVCVGPSYTVIDIMALYCQYLPTRVLSAVVPRLVRLFGLLIRPLDKRLNNKPGAHILASTTYVHARKHLH